MNADTGKVQTTKAILSKISKVNTVVLAGYKSSLQKDRKKQKK
jgi:hypothetical protein